MVIVLVTIILLGEVAGGVKKKKKHLLSKKTKIKKQVQAWYEEIKKEVEEEMKVREETRKHSLGHDFARFPSPQAMHMNEEAIIHELLVEKIAHRVG